MSDAFISYRRKPSSTLAQLIKERFQNRHHISAYLDVSRADSTKVQFPERLMQAIADSPTFICLLADTTFDSEWVRKEITQAYNLKKHCIPVFQESYQPPTFHDDAVDYLLNFDGVKIFDLQNVFMDEAIDKIALLVVRAKKRRLGVLLAGLVATIATIAILLIVALTSQNNDPITTSETTPIRNTETKTPLPSNTFITLPTLSPLGTTPSQFNPSSIIRTNTPPPQPTPTQPDLTVTNISGPTNVVIPAGETSVTVQYGVNITNNGGALNARFNNGGEILPNNTPLDLGMVGNLGAGQTISLQVNVTFTSAGTYILRFDADSGSAITESNEVNNSGTINVTVTNAP